MALKLTHSLVQVCGCQPACTTDGKQILSSLHPRVSIAMSVNSLFHNPQVLAICPTRHTQPFDAVMVTLDIPVFF